MINEILSSIISVASTTWNYLSINLFNRGVDMIEAPVNTPDMLWMLLPLLATLLLIELYFGR